MMHSQEMYDQLPIMPHSTCGAILKEIIFRGRVFWEIRIHIWGGTLGNAHTYLGGYSGKFAYILGGGYSGNLNLIPE